MIKNNLGDERKILVDILCYIGISRKLSHLIADEVRGSCCNVNEDYLITMGVPTYSINNAMKYINMFYRGEFTQI